MWYTTMQEVLEHLAQALTLEAFLEVLPEPGNSEDFQVNTIDLIDLKTLRQTYFESNIGLKL